MDAPDQLVLYFHREYHSSLLAYSISIAQRFSRNPLRGEDYVNDFYLQVMEKPQLIGSGYDKHGLRYLLRIIRNRVFNVNRSEQARRHREELYCEDRNLVTTAGETAKPLRLREMLHLAEERLSSEDLLLFRHYWEGYTTKEMGTLFDMNPQTVGVRIHRIRKDLCWYFTTLGIGREFRKGR